MQAYDYSTRRGAIVPLLSRVHALMTTNAKNDTLCGIDPPENIIFWRQRLYKQLVDIHTRWLFVLDDKQVAGVLFYHIGEDVPDIYIDELQVAWPYKGKPIVLAALLDKLGQDPAAKAARFFGSERVKSPHDKEILESRGFVETFPNGWEPLGNHSEALAALKLRYNRA